MNIYRCEHFKLVELLPEHLYKARGEAGWELFDPNLLRAYDYLRDEFGRVVVNNWHEGGDRHWSGFRDPTSPYYSPTSQHSLGKALDGIFLDSSVEVVREAILSGKSRASPLLHGIELDVSWLHGDTRNYEGIKAFKG